MVLDATHRNVFAVSSTLDGPTLMPFVQLTCADRDFQMRLTPANAQNLAWELMEAAQVSLHESFMMVYFQNTLGLEPKTAFEALDLFRQYRDMMIAPRFA